MAPYTSTSNRDPIPQGQSYRIEHANSARWTYFLHGHACYELILLLRGDCDCLVGDHESHVRAGELVLTGPHLPHTWFTQGFLPEGKRMEMDCLWIAPALIDRAAGLIPELASLDTLTAKARRGIRFRPATVRTIRPLLARLRDAKGTAAIATIYTILHELSIAKGGTILASEEALSRERDHEIRRMNEICEYLQRYFTEPLTLDQVADFHDISVSTLNNLMKKYIKSTFLQYLTHLRMNAAKDLLKSEDLPITDVAMHAGFTSIPTFNRRFKAEEGMTPQEYRKQHYTP